MSTFHMPDGLGMTLSELLELVKQREDGVAALEFCGGSDNVVKKLRTNKEKGLQGSDVELKQSIKDRQHIYGANVIPEPRSLTFLELMWEAAQDLTLKMLGVCAVVAIVLGTTVECNPETGWIEGFAILLAIFVVIFVTAGTDKQKDNQFKALKEQQDSLREVHIIRNGEPLTTEPKNIVVGDLLMVEGGDVVPADGILVECIDVEVDEAALTGESEAVKKSLDEDPFLLSGTSVAKGRGNMIVLCVGLSSQEGIINRLVTGVGQEEVERLMNLDKQAKASLEARDKDTIKRAVTMTDDAAHDQEHRQKKSAKSKESILTHKLNKLALSIGALGGLAALLCSFILFIRFIVEVYAVCQHSDSEFTSLNVTAANNATYVIYGTECVMESGWPESNWKRILEVVMTGVTVLVVAIPEGLPLAVTISLAYSVRKMMQDNNLVRILASCETMGNANTVCSDKTGTLTQNRMFVVKAFLNGEIIDDTKNMDLDKIPDDFKDNVAEGISMNSHERSTYIEVAGQPDEQRHNKTECAILKFGDHLTPSRQHAKIREETLARDGLVKQFAFDSKKKRMTTVVKRTSGKYRVYVKGAAEEILKDCVSLESAGGVKPLEQPDIDMISDKVIHDFATQALRVVLLAYKDLDTMPNVEEEDPLVSNLTVNCLVGIQDPQRPEVLGAVEACRKAGVTVRMVTGDNKDTARAIALNCGIITKEEAERCVWTGKEFRDIVVKPDESLDQQKLEEIAPGILVMARCSPTDKYNLVKGLIASKQIVAVTGDGTNDAPALAEADVGFSMGMMGTDVAKAASDIVITNDNFASIVQAISWGRNVYDAISKFLVFQLTVNIVAVSVVFICALIEGVAPLGALQLLWVNMIMDTLASLALATEPPRPELMDRSPYDREAPVVSKMMMRQMLGHTIYQMVVMLFLCFYGHEIFDIAYGLEPIHDCDQENDGLRHLTIVFNTFVWMQLFNELNSRRIDGEWNVIEGLHNNPYFLIIMVFQIAGQILIAQFGGKAFKLDPEGLNGEEWALCLGLGAGEIFWHFVVLLIPAEWVPDWMINIFKVSYDEVMDGDDDDEEGEGDKGDDQPKPASLAPPASPQLSRVRAMSNASTGSGGMRPRTGSNASSTQLTGWNRIKNSQRLWTQIRVVAAFNSLKEQAQARAAAEAERSGVDGPTREDSTASDAPLIERSVSATVGGSGLQVARTTEV